MTLAAWLGRFIGAMLAECGPVLVDLAVEIYKRATTDTAEIGATDDALRARLLARLRDADNLHQSGGAGDAAAAGEAGQGLGERQGREVDAGRP